MTIPVPDLYSGEEKPDSGSSLAADPWSTEWSLPSDVELKAVGWPGARPSQPDGSTITQAVRDPLPPEPHPMVVEETAEPEAQMSPPGPLPPPSAPSF